jgi:undecaprenyl-diphosphatase
LIITFKPTIKEEDITVKKAVTIGFGNVCHDAWNEPVSSFHYWWHAARINVSARLNSLFLAVPTMMAVTCYSVFLKTYISTERLRIDFEI